MGISRGPLFACSVAPLAVVLLLGNGASGDEPLPSFHTTLGRITAERSKLTSFEVQITAKATPLGREISTKVTVDGEREEVTRRLVSFDLAILVDEPSKTLIVARKDTFNDTQPDAVPRDDEKRFVFFESGEFVCFGRDTLAIHDRGSRAGNRPAFFDPRGLGLGFCGEFVIGTPVAEIIANYLQRDASTMAATTDDQGRLVYREPNDSFTMAINPKKDYWPEFLSVKSGDRLVSRVTVQLQQSHGRWLPSDVKVECPTEITQMKLQWQYVNRPANDSLTPQKIADKYSMTVRDFRRPAESKGR